MRKIYFIAVLFFLLGCTRSQTPLGDLIIKKNTYYSDSSSIYSGYAITKFDSGQISNEILIRDGIPSGEWVSYGYEGEVIQNGRYNPFILKFISIQDLKKYKE